MVKFEYRRRSERCIVYLMFIHTIRNTQQYEMNYYNATWFIFGIIVGYFVGWVFAKFGHDIPEGKDRDLVKTIIVNIKPLLIVLACALVIHLGFATYRQYQMDRIVAQSVSIVANQHSSYGLSILISLITTFTIWLGYAGTLNFSSNILVMNQLPICHMPYRIRHLGTFLIHILCNHFSTALEELVV